MAAMTLWQTYWRALNALGPEKGLVAVLVISNVVIGTVPLGEAYLWSRVVDALTTGTGHRVDHRHLGGARPVRHHRRRRSSLWWPTGSPTAAASRDGQGLRACHHPADQLSRRGKASGAVVRAILAGTDALFWDWLSFLREQLAAIVGVIFLVPMAIVHERADAAVLVALAVIYLSANILVFRHTSGQQTEVERYTDLTGGSATCSATSRWCRAIARLEAEMQAMRTSCASCWRRNIPC